jgi:hypothetical protein
MLRITPEQMAVFSKDAERNFLERVAAFIRDQFPEAADASDAELMADVVDQVGKAQSYGLVSERAIMSYLLAAKFLGSDFDQIADVQAFLASERDCASKALFLDALGFLQSSTEPALHRQEA